METIKNWIEVIGFVLLFCVVVIVVAVVAVPVLALGVVVIIVGMLLGKMKVEVKRKS